MIWVDYQTFTFCIPKVDGVENEESMWKHSPKSWGMHSGYLSITLFSIIGLSNFHPSENQVNQW